MKASRPVRRRPLRVLLLVALLVAFLIVLNHYAPLQPAVVFLYAGLGIAGAGLVSVIRPLRFLGVGTRRLAAVLAMLGTVIAAGALSWPTTTMRASGPHQRLDDFLPAYQFYEAHETDVAAPAERVAQAVREVSFADMPAAVLLMRVRAMAAGRFRAPEPSRRPVLEMFATPGSGFLPLDGGQPGEWVGGMAGRPWARGPAPRLRTPGEWLAFDAPGNVKVAFNMRWMPAGNGHTTLTTETRIAGTDEGARRTFARYWRVIYPGSAIIRRVWLDAVVERAERVTADGD